MASAVASAVDDGRRDEHGVVAQELLGGARCRLASFARGALAAAASAGPMPAPSARMIVSAAARPSAPRPASSTMPRGAIDRAELRRACVAITSLTSGRGLAQCRRELAEADEPEREVRPAAFGVETARWQAPTRSMKR